MKISPEIARALSAVNCLECEQPFRLPKNAAEIETLECPHCQQNLDMEQLLASIAEEMNIPTAAVVKQKDDKTTEVNDEIGVVDKDAEPATKSPQSFDDQDYVIPKPLKTAERRRRMSSQSVRRHKKNEKKRQFEKKSNPLVEFGRIAFGAVLAIPVAQLVLWWVIGIDPFTIAPKVSEYVPIIVPASLQPKSEDDIAEDQQSAEDMPEGQTMHDESNVPISINYGK